MSRKIILTLATAATIAAAGLASSAADARGFGGGGGGLGHSSSIGRVGGGHFSAKGGRKLTSILNPGGPGRPGHPGHPGHWTGLHHHGHWIFRGGRWIIIDDVVDEVPVVEPAPGPCTCLTKNYTPDGLVVFADRLHQRIGQCSGRWQGRRRDAGADGRRQGRQRDPSPSPVELRGPHL